MKQNCSGKNRHYLSRLHSSTTKLDCNVADNVIILSVTSQFSTVGYKLNRGIEEEVVSYWCDLNFWKYASIFTIQFIKLVLMIIASAKNFYLQFPNLFPWSRRVAMFGPRVLTYNIILSQADFSVEYLLAGLFLCVILWIGLFILFQVYVVFLVRYITL